MSLLPSATEIVGCIGAVDMLVGVSHECDHPPGIRRCEVLTRSRLPETATSAAIDRAVRDVTADALSIYAIDEAALARLSPDVIVTQDLCEVCAVSLDDVRAAVARLAHRDDVAIVSLAPTRIAHVLDDVERVAAALGREQAGRKARTELTARIDAVADSAREAHARPRVVSIEWIDPLMLGGTWMPELIELAGGVPVGVESGAPAPTVTPAELAALDPDVVLIKPCGFTVARTLEERATIDEQILGCVRPDTAVYLADGNAYFNRPGPRLVESLEILASCVHPELLEPPPSLAPDALVRLA